MAISKQYANFLVFLAPLINSVGGIAIDLYAPSIPSIGREFSVSSNVMQNTITTTLVAYAIGQLFFGMMADWRGRRPTVILGLVAFLFGSVLATVAHDIETLMLARAIQGFAIGACQVVARAILVDRITGDRLRVAIIYLSLAFGLGPVIAPYMGGKIEELAGWRWNFVAYAGYGLIVLMFVIFGLKESLSKDGRKTPVQTISGYREILSDSTFLSSVVMLGASFAAFLMWNVIGPYIVQEHLAYSASFFGTSALGVGVSYLVGTLLNRALVKHFRGEQLVKGGTTLFALGVAVIASGGTSLNMAAALGGVMVIAFAQGFIFSNVMARSMALFPNRAGAAASLQGCLMLVIGSIASALASAAPVETNASLAIVFGCLLAVQVATLVRLQRITLSAAP
jgi:MFS transporter, DHA1 family, multidrug resistance protein